MGTIAEYVGKTFPQVCVAKVKRCVLGVNKPPLQPISLILSFRVEARQGLNPHGDHVFLTLLLEKTEGQDDRPLETFHRMVISTT